MCWCASMCFFLYIVYELLVGLGNATDSEADPAIKSKIKTAQVMTALSWCTYPIVYLFPLVGEHGDQSGLTSASMVVAIQIGYCISDIISKCGVGIVIYQISYAKSSLDLLLLDLLAVGLERLALRALRALGEGAHELVVEVREDLHDDDVDEHVGRALRREDDDVAERDEHE